VVVVTRFTNGRRQGGGGGEGGNGGGGSWQWNAGVGGEGTGGGVQDYACSLFTTHKHTQAHNC
jgi:hypothetical protein